jgi:hypothetical protein
MLHVNTIWGDFCYVAEFSVLGRCFITVGLPIDGEQTAVQDGEYCDKDETQHLQIYKN